MFEQRDAGLYSEARHPLPECYPGTRTTLIEEILQWTRGESSEGGELLWVYGSVGAGKTAIAQTVGELMDKAGTFVAAYFFSLPRKCTDPSRFWPAICHQICERSWEFWRHIVTVAGDLTRMRERDIQFQFEQLVKVPIWTLDLERRPDVIIIDGLDECEGGESQCEIVRCILDAYRTPVLPLGVRWLIFSRPEPHLKHVFEAAEAEGLCSTKEVPIDDLETQMDIQLYLGTEFNRIANTYLGILSTEERWPKQSDLEKIFRSASGLFVYAVTVVKFVGDPVSKDPISRLQLVLDFIDGSPLPPGISNPLAYIDNLYRELIERTPSDVLETTLRILGACIICPRLPVIHFAHLLGMESDELYKALLALHSVIDVPSKAKTAEEPLKFFHASFPDFLMSPERSGRLVQDVNIHRLQLSETCFDILHHSEIWYAESMEQSPPQSFVDDEEDEQNLLSPLSMAHVILTFASTHVWEICVHLRSPSPQFLRRTVGSLDFRRLQSTCESIPPKGFVEFLQWLLRSVRSV